MDHRVFAMSWSGHVVPDSLSASQCNLEYPRCSFRLQKLPQILINLINGPFFYPQITGQDLKWGWRTWILWGLDFLQTCHECRQKALDFCPEKVKLIVSTLYTSGPPTRMCLVHWWPWCRWQFGTAHPREKARTSGQISCSWSPPHSWWAAVCY